MSKGWLERQTVCWDNELHELAPLIAAAWGEARPNSLRPRGAARAAPSRRELERRAVKPIGVLAGLLFALGCGTNAPEIPKELLGSEAGCVAPDYPSEGLGYEQGDVVRNLCFTGYRAPDRVAPTAPNRETIAFSDYYDPAGTKGVSLLLVNTAAIWCMACVDEHRTLPDHASKLGPRGLVILSTLFQDGSRNGASLDDVERWLANFGTNFPMVADPGVQLDGYASSDSAPLNLVVDPRSMKVLRKFVGNQSTLWPYIEAELDARAPAP